jgi:CheY-like chemotaxis protein
VKRLVEMHGGRVDAHSAGRGRGSEFVVRLPIVVEDASVRDAAGGGGDATLPTSELRILVVDDNRDAADSLTKLLELMGNAVHTAYDGEEAVQAAESFRPHVVLCDIGLPKMDGHEACRHIRSKPWGKDMILIAVTGWGQEEDKRTSAEAGFQRHMVKPVDPEVLMRMLAEMRPGQGTSNTP